MGFPGVSRGWRMKAGACGAARPPVPRSLHDVRQHAVQQDGSPVHGYGRVRLRGSHTDAGVSPAAAPDRSRIFALRARPGKKIKGFRIRNTVVVQARLAPPRDLTYTPRS